MFCLYTLHFNEIAKDGGLFDFDMCLFNLCQGSMYLHHWVGTWALFLISSSVKMSTWTCSIAGGYKLLTLFLGGYQLQHLKSLFVSLAEGVHFNYNKKMKHLGQEKCPWVRKIKPCELYLASQRKGGFYIIHPHFWIWFSILSLPPITTFSFDTW